MTAFLALPRYKFTRALLEYAPENTGVYGLFDGNELIYVGSAEGQTVKACLLRHQDGEHGDCTMKATHYTWEIALSPKLREAQILSRYHEARGTEPRCQSKVA